MSIINLGLTETMEKQIKKKRTKTPDVTRYKEKKTQYIRTYKIPGYKYHGGIITKCVRHATLP